MHRRREQPPTCTAGIDLRSTARDHRDLSGQHTVGSSISNDGARYRVDKPGENRKVLHLRHGQSTEQIADRLRVVRITRIVRRFTAKLGNQAPVRRSVAALGEPFGQGICEFPPIMIVGRLLSVPRDIPEKRYQGVEPMFSLRAELIDPVMEPCEVRHETRVRGRILPRSLIASSQRSAASRHYATPRACAISAERRPFP